MSHSFNTVSSADSKYWAELQINQSTVKEIKTNQTSKRNFQLYFSILIIRVLNVPDI